MYKETGNINEESVFGWVGLKENSDHYVSATGIYDFFWTLQEETRVKIIHGWIEALEAYLDPEFDKQFPVGVEEGAIYISENSSSVEDKTSANIIPFPRKD